MLSDGRPLGAHLPLSAGMVRTADRAAAIGATALQVFVDNPSSWRRRSTLPDELPAFRERLHQHGIAPLSAHAPYLVNLAAPDEVHERSVALLASELRVASAYGAACVNLHIGSHRGSGVQAGIERLAVGLGRALEAAGDDGGRVALVLENSAGAGFGLGTTIEELGAIGRALDGAGVPRDRTGFCLDTAHLWGAGHQIGTAAGVDTVIEAFDAAVGLDRLRLVHLNDSRAACGSRADRHEHLGAGQIGVEGLARLLVHPALSRVAYILETPRMDEGWDATNMARARDLAAGRPLGPLPAEAQAAGSRHRRPGPAGASS